MLFISECQSLTVADLRGHSFLENIFSYYGGNKSISTENLEDLLLLISARRPEAISEQNHLEEQEVTTIYVTSLSLFHFITFDGALPYAYTRLTYSKYK